MSDDDTDLDIYVRMPPLRSTECVLVPRTEYDALVAEVAAARAVIMDARKLHDSASVEGRQRAMILLDMAIEAYDAAVQEVGRGNM